MHQFRAAKTGTRVQKRRNGTLITGGKKRENPPGYGEKPKPPPLKKPKKRWPCKSRRTVGSGPAAYSARGRSSPLSL